MSDVKIIITENDVEYTWDGWYGAVITSYEKRKLYKGDTRIIRNFPFYIYNITQDGWWFRPKKISWLLVTPGRDIRREDIAAFKKELKLD